MTIQTIVFDFGNVVGFFDHRLTTNRLAPFAGISADALRALLFGGPLEDAFEAGKISSDQFLRTVIEQGRLRCTPEKVASAWSEIFWPNREVMNMLPLLKGRYRLLLGSNTNELHTRQYSLQFAEAFKNFDHLVYSFEVGIRKPAAGFFQHCQRLANFPPEANVFIDDLEINVEGARACGWHGIVYKNSDALREELAALGVSL
jgi:glucose-1-phosphatase